MYNTIVVGIDEDGHSADVVTAVIELAKLTRDNVVVVHVQTLGAPSPGAAPYVVEDSGQAQALLDKTLSLFADAGVSASGQLQRSTVDKVGDVILEVAKAQDAGLIAVGSRGHGEVYGALFGSTAHRVIHGAVVPVLVHRDTRDE